MDALRRWEAGPDVGAASHIGRTHHRNEDAVEVRQAIRDDRPFTAIVVCDGISASSRGDLAAAIAAAAAADVLMGEAEGTGELDPAHREHLLRTAVHLAHEATCEAAIEQLPGFDPPGTTLVAAIVYDDRVDAAWIGDSRAYLLSPANADTPGELCVLLTHDHSWVNLVVDGGEMTEAEALANPLAHAITRCVGPIEDPDPGRPAEPSLSHAVVTEGSRLVLCTDGVWGYAGTPAEFCSLVGSAGPAGSESSAADLAVALVERSLAAGGDDDMTVGVAYVGNRDDGAAGPDPT